MYGVNDVCRVNSIAYNKNDIGQKMSFKSAKQNILESPERVFSDRYDRQNEEPTYKKLPGQRLQNLNGILSSVQKDAQDVRNGLDLIG